MLNWCWFFTHSKNAHFFHRTLQTALKLISQHTLVYKSFAWWLLSRSKHSCCVPKHCSVSSIEQHTSSRTSNHSFKFIIEIMSSIIKWLNYFQAYFCLNGLFNIRLCFAFTFFDWPYIFFLIGWNGAAWHLEEVRFDGLCQIVYLFFARQVLTTKKLKKGAKSECEPW